jgi:hypothetical protein
MRHPHNCFCQTGDLPLLIRFQSLQFVCERVELLISQTVLLFCDIQCISASLTFVVFACASMCSCLVTFHLYSSALFCETCGHNRRIQHLLARHTPTRTSATVFSWITQDALWYILIMKANERPYFSHLFDKVLYMFRTCPLSIIRSISTLYTRNRYLSF